MILNCLFVYVYQNNFIETRIRLPTFYFNKMFKCIISQLQDRHSLNHCSLVKPWQIRINIGLDTSLGPNRREAITCLNQWWLVINCTTRNKLQWNFKRNTSIFVQENAFDCFACKVSAILFRPQYDKLLLPCRLVVNMFVSCEQPRLVH